MHVAFTLLARRYYYVEIIGPVRDFVEDKCISAVDVAMLPFMARSSSLLNVDKQKGSSLCISLVFSVNFSTMLNDTTSDAACSRSCTRTHAQGLYRQPCTSVAGRQCGLRNHIPYIEDEVGNLCVSLTVEMNNKVRPKLIGLCTILHTRYPKKAQICPPNNEKKRRSKYEKEFTTPPNAFNYHHTKPIQGE